MICWHCELLDPASAIDLARTYARAAEIGRESDPVTAAKAVMLRADALVGARVQLALLETAMRDDGEAHEGAAFTRWRELCAELEAEEAR